MIPIIAIANIPTKTTSGCIKLLASFILYPIPELEAIISAPTTAIHDIPRPSFNPNKYWESRQEDMGNRAVSFIYEPGSTFKAMVAGAAGKPHHAQGAYGKPSPPISADLIAAPARRCRVNCDATTQQKQHLLSLK